LSSTASRPPVRDRINESLSFGDSHREARFRHRLFAHPHRPNAAAYRQRPRAIFFEPAAGQTYCFSLSNLPK